MLLGYDTDEEGEIFIVRKEAEIVRMIFDRYLAGMVVQGHRRYAEPAGAQDDSGQRLVG